MGRPGGQGRVQPTSWVSQHLRHGECCIWGGNWLQEVTLCPTLLVMPAPNLVFRKVSSNPTTAASGWRVPLAVEQMGEPRHGGGLCLNPDIYCKPNKPDSQARS